ncbi:hypothetical protein CPAR01_15460 [Colletotrichum paranaense]|uniref:Uncharacterized protein n=1 Tax=Colletotrichum paranaense TaxID=1914294 RepID=A0ABQ9S061_9PEZI|nr:uncharacterized protein CPAR01_15460 [Colletotrichum paranaense]KAK1519967.1 hypothetical protein CPAR01_15460 [Colletotrichum paranaense]
MSAPASDTAFAQPQKQHDAAKQRRPPLGFNGRARLSPASHTNRDDMSPTSFAFAWDPIVMPVGTDLSSVEAETDGTRQWPLSPGRSAPCLETRQPAAFRDIPANLHVQKSMPRPGLASSVQAHHGRHGSSMAVSHSDCSKVFPSKSVGCCGPSVDDSL